MVIKYSKPKVCTCIRFLHLAFLPLLHSALSPHNCSSRFNTVEKAYLMLDSNLLQLCTGLTPKSLNEFCFEQLYDFPSALSFPPMKDYFPLFFSPFHALRPRPANCGLHNVSHVGHSRSFLVKTPRYRIASRILARIGNESLRLRTLLRVVYRRRRTQASSGSFVAASSAPFLSVFRLSPSLSDCESSDCFCHSCLLFLFWERARSSLLVSSVAP